MKKIISIIAGITMLFASSTTAYAAITAVPGNDSHDVVAKSTGSVAVPDVYSVDVSWGSMEFTYNLGGSKDWNASNHSYTDKSLASWSASGNTVGVTNHSNKGVTAKFGFVALSTYSTITGSFDNTSVVLPSAVDKAVNDTSLTAASTLTLSGTVPDALTNFTEVGSVTVTIE